MGATDKKTLYFEYFLKLLLKWYSEASGKTADAPNDLSTIKVLKLLFFTSAASIERDKESILLDDIFDNFYAMPYGHVESDVYNTLRERKGTLNHFKVSSSGTHPINKGEIIVDLPPNISREIELSVEYLKKVNSKLILELPFALVDLSHAWYSWQHFYKKSALNSVKIPIDIIKLEDKIFHL